MALAAAILTLLIPHHPHPDPYVKPVKPHHHHHIHLLRKPKPPKTCDTQRMYVQILQERTNHYQDVMGEPEYPTSDVHYACSTYMLHGFIRALWGVRHKEALEKYLNPPNLSAWMCIHNGEGSWTDPNPPYYGGLQMDWTFQQEYAPTLLATKGTADHWTWLEQIWTAEIARRSGRGFYPWPVTARRCGLI